MCVFSGTREVRYGGNGKFVTKLVTGPVACTNAVFGDPAKSTAKTCSYASTSVVPTAPTTPAPAAPAPTATWTLCASENGTCTFSGTREVRYGSGSYLVTRVATGSISCSNAVFGDPKKSTAKFCWYSSVTR
jgi:hypothetical protein